MLPRIVCLCVANARLFVPQNIGFKMHKFLCIMYVCLDNLCVHGALLNRESLDPVLK